MVTQNFPQLSLIFYFSCSLVFTLYRQMQTATLSLPSPHSQVLSANLHKFTLLLFFLPESFPPDFNFFVLLILFECHSCIQCIKHSPISVIKDWLSPLSEVVPLCMLPNLWWFCYFVALKTCSQLAIFLPAESPTDCIFAFVLMCIFSRLTFISYLCFFSSCHYFCPF